MVQLVRREAFGTVSPMIGQDAATSFKI